MSLRRRDGGSERKTSAEAVLGRLLGFSLHVREDVRLIKEHGTHLARIVGNAADSLVEGGLILGELKGSEGEGGGRRGEDGRTFRVTVSEKSRCENCCEGSSRSSR